jgi:hypothetical protein
MIVKCQKCGEKYERFNVGGYQEEEPHECEGTKLMKCQLCGEKTTFKLCGFKEKRRFQCTNCKGYFVPFRMRHFGNVYADYPKWITQKDWIGRKFAPEMVVAGASEKEINELLAS